MTDADRKMRQKNPAIDENLIVSTTEGRARFPDLLQISMAEKTVFGFDRYGRLVGAMVPMEAVRMLAGFTGHVDDDVQERIQGAALALLRESPVECRRLGIAFDEDDDDGQSLDDIRAARASLPASARKRPRKRAD